MPGPDETIFDFEIDSSAKRYFEDRAALDGLLAKGWRIVGQSHRNGSTGAVPSIVYLIVKD